MNKVLATIITTLATMCLGVILLVPVLNLFVLKEVMRQETGVSVNYWLRGFGK